MESMEQLFSLSLEAPTLQDEEQNSICSGGGRAALAECQPPLAVPEELPSKEPTNLKEPILMCTGQEGSETSPFTLILLAVRLCEEDFLDPVDNSSISLPLLKPHR